MARRRAGRAAIPGCRSPPTAATSRSSPGPRISFQARATAAPTCSSATANSAPPNGSASGRAGPRPTGRARSGRCRRSRPTGAPSPSSPTRPTSSRTTPTARPTSSSTTVERAGGAGRARGLGRMAMRSPIGGAVALAATLAAVPVWAGGTTERVSVGAGSRQVFADSYASGQATVSAEGRYVVFESRAARLVSGDTNQNFDVFVRDRHLGTNERVSVGPGGTQGDRNSGGFLGISGDSRFAAFYSKPSNLVPNDTNHQWDIFLHGRQDGTNVRVDVGPGGAQIDNSDVVDRLSLSEDGHLVAFSSRAAGFVAGDTNDAWDVFVRDTRAGTNERVSVASDGGQANGPSLGAAISADGRYVAFYSDATNLVPNDTNGWTDVFVHDRKTRQTERGNLGPGGAQADDNGYQPAISRHGRYVAFSSSATNLLPGGDRGAESAIYVRDRLSKTTELVSAGLGGGVPNGGSGDPSISGDGRYVAFVSAARNLVPGDDNGAFDVFVRDRLVHKTERVSVTTAGRQANGDSFDVTISEDGHAVAFD